MIEIYTDGASQGNPGPSGAGIFIKTGQDTYEYSLPLKKMSNHEAEFQAVIHALDICQKHFPNEILSFRSDARVVVDTMEKGYTKNKTFKPLLDTIQQKANSFPYVFIKWIREQENTHADLLAKHAIQNQLHQ